MTPAVVEPTGVALVSRVLSLGFTPPDPETLEQLRRLTALSAQAVEDDGLAELLAELGHALEADDLLGFLQPAYEELFGGTVRFAPYEASYGDPIRGGREMADVAGFYRAFGAESSGPGAERPDHAGCELEFLSFLAVLRLEAESEGDEERVEICREAEDAFLRDHLGRWLPNVCRDLAEGAGAIVYRLVGVIGERFVAGELARRGIVVSPAPPRRRTAVESDEVTCDTGEPARAEPASNANR